MNISEYKKMRLSDPQFKKAYDEAEGEYQAMRAVYIARTNKGMTQKELSEITNIPQKTISNIETATVNTSVNMLARIAQGLGKELKIEFV